MREGELHFYFDFMSPFAYLAFQRIPGICARYGLKFEPHVMDLPKIKLLAGNTGPANVTIPLKIKYLKVDLERWAKRYGVVLEFPQSLNTHSVNKAFLYAKRQGKGEAFIRSTWMRLWGEGGDPSQVSILEELARRFRWNPNELIQWVESSEAQEEYEASTQAAHEAGVFGAPIMIIGDKMWWGNDRLDMMEETLQGKDQ